MRTSNHKVVVTGAFSHDFDNRDAIEIEERGVNGEWAKLFNMSTRFWSSLISLGLQHNGNDTLFRATRNMGNFYVLEVGKLEENHEDE